MKYVTSHKKWVELTRRALTTQKREVLLPDGTRGLRNFNELFGLLPNSNKGVREEAAIGYNSILASVLDVAEAEINAIVTNKKTDDELRNFTQPDAALLLKDGIEPQVVDVMLDSVERRYDISHRFYQLKAQLLGVEKLEYAERYLQLGSLSRHYDWATACHIVDEVYRKLDPYFSELFRTYLSNGQIDALPRLGKEPNAFTSRFHKSVPSYILVNHTGTLSNVITLAHEFGHGLTNEYMRQNQLSLNFNIYHGTAEVASQYFEEFTYEHILVDADEDMRLIVNMGRLDKAINSIQRQVACYRFEQELHSAIRKNGYLSAAEIGQLFQGEMSAYMGPAVIQSAGSENWWVQWQHIRKMFINYSYASGNLIAKAMYRATKENKGFLDNVKTFMSTGISASQRDTFAKMGIDISDSAFWVGSLEQVEVLLDECEKLAITLGKIPAR